MRSMYPAAFIVRPSDGSMQEGKDPACLFLRNGRSSSVFLLIQASPVPVAMK